MNTSRIKALSRVSLFGVERRLGGEPPHAPVAPPDLEHAGRPGEALRVPGTGHRVGYRPEVDGLRAIAVFMVILYHAEFRLSGYHVFGGGFVGVDVFFVISGYLIGSIIQKEIASGSFSFLNFYERRARRILPPLYVVLAASIPFAWLILMPGAFSDWSLSLLATVLSVSNLFFWHSGGYDTAENLVRPLIHTWSLGVEEQFYLFVPLIMVMLWKWARNSVGVVLLAGCALSLVFAEWMTQRSSSASFFLLSSRAWELGIGVALAWRELRHGRRISPPAAIAMPIIGLALLMTAVVVMSPQWHHPGMLTLIPVVGSALLIWYTGGNDPVSRLLSSRPFVFVGLISYSLYLWHQPIFAFGRLGSPDGVDTFMVLGWILLALVLATATYFLVEVPTRDRRRTSSRSIWLMAVVGAALLGGFGAYGYATKGLPGRFQGDWASIASASAISEAEIRQDGKSCLDFKPEQGPCIFKGANADGYALVSLGDSHARTLTGAMRDALADDPMLASFTPLNRGGCVFLLGVGRVNEDEPSCPDDYNLKRLAYVTKLQSPVAVLLSRMPLLVEQSRYDNGEGGVEPGDDHPHLAAAGATGPAEPDLVGDSLTHTVRALLDQAVKVVLVYPVPEMGWNVPQVLLMRAWGKDDVAAYMQTHPLSVSQEHFRQRTRRTYALYDGIGEDPNLLRVYPEKLFCDGQRCFGNEGSTLFYRDDNHLSSLGATRLVGAIMDAVQERWSR